MAGTNQKRLLYLKRKRRVRKKIKGSPSMPRLNVYRSNKHIFAQIIDDTKGKTIVSSSTLDKEVNKEKGEGKIEIARRVGELVGARAKSKGIKKVVFDRNGFLYHGRVKALAEGARKEGLKF